MVGFQQTPPMCNRQRAIIVYTLGGVCDCDHYTYPDTRNGCPATSEEWADIIKIADRLERFSCLTWYGEPKLDPRILQTLRERYPHLEFDIRSRIVGTGQYWWNRDFYIRRVLHPAAQSYPQQQAFPGQTEPVQGHPADAQPVQGYPVSQAVQGFPVSQPVHGHPVSEPVQGRPVSTQQQDTSTKTPASTAPDADSAPEQ